MGDKTTRPYLKSFGTVQEWADKIIFCLRDPRDIFRSKYWSLAGIDSAENHTYAVNEYVVTMQNVLACDLSNVLFIRYEWAVNNIESVSRVISKYLGFRKPIDITGHNYKPVRRFGWKKEPEVVFPHEVYEIMSEFGYENTIRS